LAGRGLSQLGIDLGTLLAPGSEAGRRWSWALWSHPQRPDGLIYRSRRDPSQLLVALYDRVAPALALIDTRRIEPQTLLAWEPSKTAAARPGAKRRLKVFLCHGSEDKAAVRSLYERLWAEGMEPWLDEKDIELGADWDQAIRRAIRNCDIVLVLLSQTSIDKAGYVQKEIRFALDRAEEMPEGRTYIIPVKLEQCDLPQRLSRWQYAKLYDPTGYQRLIETLKSLAVALMDR
jgi:TIR domain